VNLKFLKVKGVPTLFWSSGKALTLRPPPVSLIILVIGLFIFGLGEALLVAAGIGVSPWTVLAEGVTLHTGWSLGFATLIISTGVLLLWIPLKRTPGIGTILNILIIAAVLEYILPFLPAPKSLLLSALQSTVGVLVTGIGGAIYLVSNLGPGPRDGLMTGLQELTQRPIAQVRGGLEVFVVSAGWLLGGTAGLGTVLFAFGIGPAVALGLYVLNELFGSSDKPTR